MKYLDRVNRLVRGHAVAAGPGLPQFQELAEYYDALNDWKDYRGECERLESIARRFGPPGRTTWLDLACGTGRHLEFLRRRHPVVGLDGSRNMLRVARRRLPGVELIAGDMRTFQLNRRFDVVSCLFGAIGHLETIKDVRTAFANFARHLNPDGVALVEPWLSPSEFRPGMITLRTHESPAVTAVRFSSSSRRGIRSTIRYHFLIGEPGHKIRRYEETDVKLLLSRPELLGLMRGAGLSPRYLVRGLSPGRGLLVGVKVAAGRVKRPAGSSRTFLARARALPSRTDQTAIRPDAAHRGRSRGVRPRTRALPPRRFADALRGIDRAPGPGRRRGADRDPHAEARSPRNHERPTERPPRGGRVGPGAGAVRPARGRVKGP